MEITFQGSKWKAFKEICEVGQALAVIIGFIFAYHQLSNVEKQIKLQSIALENGNNIASANFVLEMDKRLDDKKYDKIIKAIEDNDGSFPIRKKSGGKFSEGELDDILGLYDTIGMLRQDNLIRKEMALNEFGYDVEKTYCNNDIQKYINEARVADRVLSGSKAFYAGFEYLAKECLAIDNKTCKNLDEE